MVFLNKCLIKVSIFNLLPNQTFFDLTKSKAFADDKWNVAIGDRVESIVGNVESAGYQPFLLFHQCFQVR